MPELTSTTMKEFAIYALNCSWLANPVPVHTCAYAEGSSSVIARETSLVIIPEHYGNLARYFSGINNSDSKSRKKQVRDSCCFDESNA